MAELLLQEQQARTLAANRVNLPHRDCQGLILTNDGVSWIAKLMLADDVVLVGRGDCPATALNDFDEQWLGIK